MQILPTFLTLLLPDSTVTKTVKPALPTWLKLQYKPLFRSVLTAVTVLVLSACAGTTEENDDPTAGWSAQQLYQHAQKEVKDGDYQLAIEYYETLESRFPFGTLAENAQMEAVYAHYKYEEYDSAIASADRFIKLHPTHPNVDYMYYLRGLASFHKKDSPLDSLVPQDPAMRDPSSAKESFNYFSKLVKHFPSSKYVLDAIKRMKFQRNTLAMHEIKVADYYLEREAYVAVINRAKYVVEHYPRTPAVEKALKLLNIAYTKLQMHELAQDAKRVLEKNYPEPSQVN